MRRDGHVLNNMNLSSSSDAMRSIVSWCRIVASNEEELSTNWHKHVIHELHYVYEGELQLMEILYHVVQVVIFLFRQVLCTV